MSIFHMAPFAYVLQCVSKLHTHGGMFYDFNYPTHVWCDHVF